MTPQQTNSPFSTVLFGAFGNRKSKIYNKPKKQNTMPIKYNVIKRGEPGVVGGGTKKWYAVVSNNGELSVDDPVKQIEKFSALSEADIRGVIIALENVIQDGLANGKIIRLDKLGSFYPSLSSNGSIDQRNSTPATSKEQG